MRLIDRLKQEFGLSGHKAKDLLNRRLVFVNDRRAWIASFEVSPSDRITIPIPGSARKAPSRQEPVFLFEDADLLAMDKPAGLSSTGTASAESLVRTARPGSRPVHRLDKDTSGVLLFGRSKAGYDGLLGLFKSRTIEKTYWALVAGKFPSSIKQIEEPLDGLPSLTELSILAASDRATLLEVRIRTGRTHQIRRHLALKGFRMVGEKEYGKGPERNREFQKISRQILHARSVAFRHPITSAAVKILAPAPADFSAACAAASIRLPGNPASD